MPTVVHVPFTFAPVRYRSAGVVTPPATPSRAAASAIGLASAGVDVLTTYLRTLRLEERAEAVAAIRQAQLEQATGRALANAEGEALIRVGTAQMANEARLRQALEAANAPLSAPPPASSSNTGVVVAVGVTAVAAIGLAAYLYSTRKKRR